ncbi:response regulator transcription factor [Entomohabitans teleogrylli]|uniref:response regulator transcription factor n=1 Tax=Entomohabitans teleogrylli TaxID=1384589 RepID=UPI00073D2E20|nr:LuxR C-terminal-related transcriptional regulator [Entomohabitans teleogrylli]
MLHGSQRIIVMSRFPLVVMGLSQGISKHFSSYSVFFCPGTNVLSAELLAQSALLVGDLSGEREEIESDIRTITALQEGCITPAIFLIPGTVAPELIEPLLKSGNTLLSNRLSLEELIGAIQQTLSKDDLTHSPLEPDTGSHNDISAQTSMLSLTLSERRVLRLLAKGWSINQISSLLNKSNKTISAQKNSAMRRLSLRSNAEMYAWINSLHGMWELNLLSSKKEAGEWN